MRAGAVAIAKKRLCHFMAVLLSLLPPPMTSHTLPIPQAATPLTAAKPLLLQLSQFASQARLPLYHCCLCLPHSHGALWDMAWWLNARLWFVHCYLLLYVSEDGPSTCLHYSATFKLLLIELKLRQIPLLLPPYYHTPSFNRAIVVNLDALVSLTPSQLETCIFLGDFNVDELYTNQLSCDLIVMLSSFPFTQVVSEHIGSLRSLTRLLTMSTSLIPLCSHPALYMPTPRQLWP